jgi:hypothetical protein
VCGLARFIVWHSKNSVVQSLPRTRARAHTHTQTHTPAALWSPHESSRKQDLMSYCRHVEWCFIFDSFSNLVCYFNPLNLSMCHVIRHFKSPPHPAMHLFRVCKPLFTKTASLVIAIEAHCFLWGRNEVLDLFFQAFRYVPSELLYFVEFTLKF